MTPEYLTVRRVLLQGIARCRLQLAYANRTQDARLKSRVMTTWNLCRSGLRKYPLHAPPQQLDLFSGTVQDLARRPAHPYTVSTSHGEGSF